MGGVTTGTDGRTDGEHRTTRLLVEVLEVLERRVRAQLKHEIIIALVPGSRLWFRRAVWRTHRAAPAVDGRARRRPSTTGRAGGAGGGKAHQKGVVARDQVGGWRRREPRGTFEDGERPPSRRRNTTTKRRGRRCARASHPPTLARSLALGAARPRRDARADTFTKKHLTLAPLDLADVS